MKKNGLDFLVCLQPGQKRLITDKPLSLLSANSPAPLSLPLSLSFFLLCICVFVLQTGLEAVYPWRIGSG